jgi:hypothetical protein
MTDTLSGLDLARKVLRIEAAAILGLVDRINGDFEHAVQLLYDCKGRVIVTGMGKSGLICGRSRQPFEHRHVSVVPARPKPFAVILTFKR